MSRLRDNWFVFALIALLLSSLTIIYPQIKLLGASLLGEGGGFTVVHRASGVEIVPQMTSHYKPEAERTGYSIGISSGAPLILTETGTTTLSLQNDNGIEVEQGSDDTVLLRVNGVSMVIGQQAPRGLFSKATPAPLAATQVTPNEIALKHSENAYVSFEDRSLYLTIAHYVSFFTNSDTVRATLNSLFIALTATALAGVIAVSLAYMMARYEIAGTNAIIFLITMATVSPPFLGGYAWRLLLGRNGLITRTIGADFSIVGIHGVIWVIIWHIFPVIFLLSHASFRNLDAGHIEAAESLGGRPSIIRRSIEVPLAMPGIITGLYLATMAALADFGTPRIIGLDVNVLPVLIYTSFLSEAGRNPALAATGSVVLVVISSLFLLAQQIYLAKRGFAVVSSRPLDRRPLSKVRHALVLIFAGTVILTAFIPHLTVFVTSFLEWRVGLPQAAFTLRNYTTMMQTGLDSAWVTLSLGFAGTIVATVCGLGIAYVIVRKRYAVVAPALNFTVMMPYVIPGTVLGIGLIMILNDAPLQLTGTWFILALAYVIRNLPFTVKASEASLRQIHPALEEAAISLGARPWRVFFQITAPLMLAGAVTGATLTFLHIVTELSSTIVLYRPPWKPMTAVIFENTLADSDFGVSAAQTILLMLIIYIPLYLIVRYGQSRRTFDV